MMERYYNTNEAATDKAYAKIVHLGFEIESNKKELLQGTFGPITREEMFLILKGNEKELNVWKYIMSLLEQDENWIVREKAR
tara:strand:- start:1062 stop:1307 length:246 start_codon:yes stop_codon:yes gene_type:complete